MKSSISDRDLRVHRSSNLAKILLLVAILVGAHT